MRLTVRLNDEEKAKLEQLKAIIHEDNDSTALKFAMDWTLHNIKVVTNSLISPNYEVIFRRKSKRYESKMKVFRK